MFFHRKTDIGMPGITHKAAFKLSKPYIKNKTILNVGCWTGSYEYLLKPIPCKTISIDINKDALKVGKKSCNACSYIQASVLSLPFHNKSFDVVTMWLVLEHLLFELPVLLEIYRILKGEGIYIFSVPHNHSLYNVFDLPYYLGRHKRYKNEDIVNLLASSGLKIEKLFYKGNLLYSLWTVFFAIFKHIFRSRMPNIRFLERKLEKMYDIGSAEIYVIAKKSGSHRFSPNKL